MTESSLIAIQFADAVERRKRELYLRALEEPSSQAARSASETKTSPAVLSGDTDAAPSPADETRAAETLAACVALCEERAAVSGEFVPDELVAEVDRVPREDVLARLASVCDCRLDDGKVRWLLNPRQRRAVLTRLHRENRLTALLHEQLPQTDAFGAMLRELLLTGENTRVDGRNRTELINLLAAIEATAGTGISHPDEREIRRLIGPARVIDEYDVLLRHGFVGRLAELNRLKDFATAPRQPQLFDALVLAGVGGAGKSTLLAQFARAFVDEMLGTIVLLDFDRPGIDATDTHWLEREIARQVAQQHTESAEELRIARLEARDRRSQRAINAVQQAGDAESYSRSFKSVLHAVGRVLGQPSAQGRPLLLVLDTFEEVADRGLVEHILEWLSDIADAIAPAHLKVLFSGRMVATADNLALDPRVRDRIDIPDLDEDDAAKLLELHDVPLTLARRLVASEVLPRRPLELKLLAKLVEGQDENGVEALEDELRRGEGAAQRMFAGVVYQRVLLRVSDDIVRKLAYPGLVLRYVTPDIVREVLVPTVTDLPPLDDEEAERALDSLASHDWLAYRDTLGAVWHRKDLRRSMLKAMIAEQPDLARGVSRAARKYFESRRSPADRAEAVYHRLLMMRRPADGLELSLSEIERAASRIQADAADFPPEGGALFRFAQNLPLSVDELGRLPVIHREKAYRSNGQRLLKSRELGKALALLEMRGKLLPGARRERERESWEREVLFATASWRELRGADGQTASVSKKAPALQRAASLVYPTAVLDPSRVNFKALWAAIADAGGDSKAVSRIPEEDRETILDRFAAGLICLAPEWIGRGSVRGRIKHIVHAALRPPSLGPAVEQRLLLLNLTATGKLSRDARLSVSTLPLDVFRLREAERTPGLSKEAVIYLNRLAAVVEEHRHHNASNVSVRSFLTAVDTLPLRELHTPIDLELAYRTQLLTLLRGGNREFRDPCRFALLEAYSSADDHVHLGRLVAASIGHVFADLPPRDVQNRETISAEHALITTVELVDRVGALGELMRRVAEDRPDARKARDVRKAYERWDTAITDSITSSITNVTTSAPNPGKKEARAY